MSARYFRQEAHYFDLLVREWIACAIKDPLDKGLSEGGSQQVYVRRVIGSI